MRITDVSKEHESIFACCLEDRESEAKESGDIRQNWIDHMKDRGFRAKLAFHSGDTPAGMIQYAPSAETLLDGGPGSYYVYCIWVSRYKDDRGNNQGKGLGTALLEAAELDVKELGGSGLAAWGLSIPVWMKASWFKKHGYRVVDRSGIAALVWKPFADNVAPPKFVHPVKEPESIEGQVTVTSFTNGWCRASNVAYTRAKRAAAEAGEKVVFHEISTLDLSVAREWGMMDALFIDSKKVNTGPPPTYEKLKRLIQIRVNRLY